MWVEIVVSLDVYKRQTKALAWAVKSKMMLFAASPLFNAGEDHWEEAYQMNKQAVEAVSYTHLLVPGEDAKAGYLISSPLA